MLICWRASSRVGNPEAICNATRSQALCIQLWFGCTRILQVSGKHSASMDWECPKVTEADRAGNRGSAALGEAHPAKSTASKSRAKKCQQAIQGRAGPLGDSL